MCRVMPGRSLVLATFLMMAANVSAAWTTISASSFTDENGIERFPACSQGDTFSFFVDEPESSEGLLLYFAGGGACWDAATCVGSAQTDSPTYYGSIWETAESLDVLSADVDGSGAGGILTTRLDNPYARFVKVYIPYCTGDVHIGSSDTNYDYALPSEAGVQTAPSSRTIHHRGFDNLLAALTWIRSHLSINDFGEITVAGSSAGGYGALLNFPVIRESLGAEGADYSIIIDSSNGVLTNGFVDRAFGQSKTDPGVWNARQNLHQSLAAIPDLDASSLWVTAIKTVARRYRDTRLSQSTAAYDLVQSIVYWTMKAVDQGTYDPFVEPTQNELLLLDLLEWSPKARWAMVSTALQVPNYRYYLGAGQGHIHLLLDEASSLFPTTNYFEEDSAMGVLYTDWLHDMLYNNRFLNTDWRNLTCFPNCL